MHIEQINEGSSNFSSKLTTFLKDVPKQDQAFIKQALNFVYLGLGKEFGGYIEGKRPIIKNKNTYSYMTWKIQTKESTNYAFYNIMSKYWKPTGHKPMNLEIDGIRYYAIVKDVKETPDYVPAARDFHRNFSVDTATIIGVYSASYKNEKVDPNAPGDTFKFIVSVPNASYTLVDNPEVEKVGMKYFFRCKDGSAEFDAGSNEFCANSSSGLRSLYKASRNAEKAFQEIYQDFKKTWSIYELEGILKDNKVPLSTSYYPDLI